MAKSERQFNGITEGVIWQQLILFLIPLFFQSVFQQIFGIADAVIVGQGVGKYALGAVSSTSNLTKLFLNLFQGFCGGASIIVGQAWGARDEEKVRRTVHTAFAFALAGGALTALFCIPMTPYFLRIMRVPADMAPYSDIYTRIIFFGFIGVFLYDTGAGILRAIGDSKRPFYYLVSSLALNVLLNLLFVLVFRWGVAGVAISTAISHFVSAALVIQRLCRVDNAARLFLRRIRFYREELSRTVRLGIPMAISGILYSISNIAIQSTINSLGTDVIAGRSVTSNITSVIWSFYDAVGIAASTFAAQNYGAGKMERVRGSVRSCITVSAAIILPVCAVIFVFIGPLARIFIRDPVVIGYAAYAARLEVPFLIFYLFGEVFTASIRGCGETLRPMLLTLIGTCGFRVLWVVILHTVFTPTLFNVTIGYPVSWIVHSSLVSLYYFFGKWRERLQTA